jgi:hypothetical protein
MRNFYIGMFIVGVALSVLGALLGAKTGYEFSFSELPSIIFSPKLWHLEKDSYFFLLVLGISLIVYSAFELNLKRWKKH